MSQTRYTKKRKNRHTGSTEVWDNQAMIWLLLIDVPSGVDTVSIPTVSHNDSNTVNESDTATGSATDSIPSWGDSGSSSSFDSGSSSGSDFGSSFSGGGFDGGGMGGGF